MANFPTNCGLPLYPLNETTEDGVLRSQSEAGYQITRPRYTKVRKQWNDVTYHLTTSQKDELVTFYHDTLGGGAESFTWYPFGPTGTAYSVRLTGPIVHSYIAPDLWESKFAVLEV